MPPTLWGHPSGSGTSHGLGGIPCGLGDPHWLKAPPYIGCGTPVGWASWWTLPPAGWGHHLWVGASLVVWVHPLQVGGTPHPSVGAPTRRNQLINIIIIIINYANRLNYYSLLLLLSIIEIIIY